MTDAGTSGNADATANQRQASTRFARRGFARLAYEIRGEGTRTVVLLHDLLADRASLGGLRDSLVGRGFRVLLPDLRGHGASAAIPGVRFTVAELVLDLRSILDAEAVTRADVIGVGFGGTVGLDFAVAEPNLVTRLALIDPFLPGLTRDDPDPEVSAAAHSEREEAAKIAELASKGSIARAFDLHFGAREGSDWQARRSKPALAAMRRHGNAFGPLLNAAYNYRPAGIEPHDPAHPALILLTASLTEQDRPGIARLRSLLPNPLVDEVADAAQRDEVIVRFLEPSPVE